MKKFLSSLMVALVVYTSFAVDATFTISPDGAAKNSNYINGPILVTALQFVNGSITLPNTITVYDSAQTNSTLGPAQGWSLTHYSNAPVNQILSYITNRSMIYTGFSGVKFTNTERFVHTYTNQVAATSNEFRRVFQTQLPLGVGQTATIPISDAGVWFARGLTVSNSTLNTNIQINVSYFPGL